MNCKQNRSTIVFVLFAFVLAGLASCHRGYGCPTNLKAGHGVVTESAKSVKTN